MMISDVHILPRRSDIALLIAVSTLCASGLFASGLTNGHYQFKVQYALVCLNGKYPITVNTMTTNCYLSLNTDASGALSGTPDIRTVLGTASGTFVSQDNATSIHLHVVGQDPLQTVSDIDAQLSGTSQFIGTASSSGQSALATMDVSMASPLIVTFDVDLTVDGSGAVTGAGTASSCGVQVPVNVTGNNGANCVLHIVGANLPQFTWDGSGPTTPTGFIADWTAKGFGASASGTHLAIPPSQLTNISTRLHVLTGNNVLIAGFIVTGSDNKKVILRALGPTLTSFGVTDALQDPTIELHDSTGAIIVSNDNWKDTQQNEITATGKAPPNDREAAILRSLAPGSYTAIVRGKNATTGTALVELYDVDQLVNARLSNISTRGFVGTDNGVIIGGFIVSPGDSVNVVVRGLGPTLTKFGVTNALQDPTLSLRNANGTEIASNDNWWDTQRAELQAVGRAPPDDHESAIKQTLTPGNYTVIERGNNNTTGVGLVEVYKVP
jgi:hypothetical protein